MGKKYKIILTVLAFALIIFATIIDHKYVKFENNDITINIGEKKLLNVKTNYENFYCFSDNEDIIRVVNMCDIEANGVGKAVVTVNAGYLSDDIIIEVIDNSIEKPNEVGEKEPEKEPIKEPEKEPEKEPAKEPEKEPEKEPVKEPEKEPEKEPVKEPEKEPEKEPIKEPEKIYFNFVQKSHSLVIGEKYEIQYNTNYKGNINFNVSNNNITIKNNTVYANKEGSSTITFEYNGILQKMDIIVYGKNVTATFNKNDSNGVSYTLMACTIKEINSSCQITLPNIYVNDNYKVLGFKKQNSDVLYKVNDKVNINKDEVFYAVIEKNNKITINYVGNGAEINKTSDSCYGSTCSFVLPEIRRDNYQILGYSENPNYTYAQYKVGQNIVTDKSMTLYAITSKVLTAFFLNNDVVTLIKPTGNWEYTYNGIKTICTIYNTQEGCYIFTPTVAKTSESYRLTGFKHYNVYGLGQRIYLNGTYEFISLYKNIYDYNNSDVNIYMSTNGNDSNTGLNKNYPVKTLSRVQEMLKKLKNVKNITVYIEPGTYDNQHVIWNYYNEGNNILFTSTSDTYPIFKGNSSTLPWFSFSLNNTSLVNINFSFSKIKVENYFTGISIKGGSGKLKNITFDNMIFNNMGSKSINYISKQAILLKNTNGVTISNSKFTNLLSSGDHCMNAIRLNGTSASTIKNNTFINVDGDTIVFENGSNSNNIIENTFTFSGYYGFVTENYSNSYLKSYNNKLTQNKFNSGFLKFKILDSVIIENEKLIHYSQSFTSRNESFYRSLSNMKLNKMSTSDYNKRINSYNNQ